MHLEATAETKNEDQRVIMPELEQQVEELQKRLHEVEEQVNEQEQELSQLLRTRNKRRVSRIEQRKLPRKLKTSCGQLSRSTCTTKKARKQLTGQS